MSIPEYTPITGNPGRKTLRKRDDDSAKKSTVSRKRRVQVTPRDREALEDMADRLGLPLSKVYNVAFQLLKEKYNH